MRGLWVVRDSLKSPQSIREVVATAVKYHLNALFVQVRGRGDAWYNSPYEPRADILANQPSDFDPLSETLKQGHAAGLEVHAWMNTYLTWTGDQKPRSAKHLWNAHRDWFAVDRNGNCSPRATDKSEGAFLSPSNPAVQEHLHKVFLDVAMRYDVDGIHFDYCRYAGSDYDFRQGAVSRFRDYMCGRISLEERKIFDSRLPKDKYAYIHAFGKDWAEWRRIQVTQLVTKISQSVKTAKPWVKVSAAVFANAEEAYTERGQDWRGWLQANTLDAVALMAYDRNTQRIVQQTRDAVAIAGEKHVYTGIGAWRLQAHDVANKIAAVREAGASGVNLFSYDSVHTRPRYLETLSRGVFASRSGTRGMRWLPKREEEEKGR